MTEQNTALLGIEMNVNTGTALCLSVYVRLAQGAI